MVCGEYIAAVSILHRHSMNANVNASFPYCRASVYHVTTVAITGAASFYLWLVRLKFLANAGSSTECVNVRETMPSIAGPVSRSRAIVRDITKIAG